MASPPECIDCTSKVGECRLICQKHSICVECLNSRASRGLVNACSICPDVIAAPTGNVHDVPAEAEKDHLRDIPIWIYVDDSNIWIEAKKHASKISGFKTKEDHRVRIEIGRLTDVVADGRRVAQGFLYGSEPPPVDTVWEKIKQKGWKVDPKRRSRMTGKEKKVDTQLVADVTEKACDPQSQKSTIILVTGDADAIPAIDVALRKEWNVEIVMWKQAVSAELKKLAKQNDSKLMLRYLDDFLEKITFTNRKFQIAGNEHLLPFIKESGVVLKIKKGKFSKGVPSQKWCRTVEAIAQWPFQYYWIDHDRGLMSHGRQESNHLVLVFKRDGKNVFDVKEFIATANELQGDLFMVDEALPYFQYEQTAKGMILALHEVGRFKFDEVFNHDEESVYASNDEESGAVSFELVKYHYRRKKQCYSDPCPYKMNCKFGGSCLYKHTSKEKAFFRDNMGKGKAFRKVKPCQYFPNCAKGREECIYAHGEEDAWCLICCDSKGHFTNNCTTHKYN